ncbi:alpha/beta hydrolase [Enterococcus wangshanyuanii]|uniref:Carboxymethylenebutenolidase n=1 Tax=Enterococcus wangshanyuanii TaxID=2005703 RepID=A0ABQ1NQ33_9ENTE|nr:alpha/beta hydrolase [Enterococcus wangshanyuanii]GGC80957.1 carboxymethylenebutenolidase [Enterococcus wangshanyuanii]
MKKWQKRLLWIFGAIVALTLIGLFYLKTITYTPTTAAIESAKQAEKENGVLVFKGDENKPSVIFYQGALVENTSYSPWAQQVAKAGYSVYLVQQPFNLAVLGQNKAESVIKDNKLTNYVIGGHSLGGVMASRFAADQEEQATLKGVFFLASYPDEKGSLAEFNGQVLSLTGSEDGVLNWKAYEDAKKYLPKQTLYEEINGGNHAGFGSYGEQKGDQPALINNDEQQKEVAERLIKWLDTIK